MRVRILPEALAEIREARRYYDGQRRGLGKEFRDAIDEAVGTIRSFPEGWQDVGEGFRRRRARPFPYNLVYRVEGDEIVIIAVAHERREPGYWRDRV